MTYFGDCRDLHYAESDFSGGKCTHLVHDTGKCVFGHVKCSGKRACIDRVHKMYPDVYGEKCPYY